MRKELKKKESAKGSKKKKKKGKNLARGRGQHDGHLQEHGHTQTPLRGEVDPAQVVQLLGTHRRQLLGLAHLLRGGH